MTTADGHSMTVKLRRVLTYADCRLRVDGATRNGRRTTRTERQVGMSKYANIAASDNGERQTMHNFPAAVAARRRRWKQATQHKPAMMPGKDKGHMNDENISRQIEDKLERLKTLDPIAVEKFNFHKHEWNLKRRLTVLDIYLKDAEERVEAARQSAPILGDDGRPLPLGQTRAFEQYCKDNAVSRDRRRAILVEAHKQRRA